MSTGLATRTTDNAETEIVRSAPTMPPSILAPIIRAEMDAAIVTAHQYPRSVTRFLDNAMSLATLSMATATQCCYALPRDGKTIEGPSVRLAEIVASQYGNIQVDARIVEESQRYVTAQAVARDLETNTTWRQEVRRSIWSNGNPSKGRPPGRFSDDMVNVVCNAAISIASRNVIFHIVPKALYWDVYLACKQIVKEGDKGKTIGQRRSEWLVWAKELGYKDAELFEALKVKGADDIGLEELTMLSGFQTAVQNNETTWDDIFRPAASGAPEPEPGPQPSKADRLVETLGKKNGGKDKAAKPEPAAGEKAEGWELGGGRE